MNAVAQETEHPLSKLELEDIFLVSSETRVSREYNQTARLQTNLLTSQRMSVEDQVNGQVRIPSDNPDARIQIVRFFAVAEVNLAMPGIAPPSVMNSGLMQGVEESKDWLKDEDKLASLRFVFAADYRCTDGNVPGPEHLGTFIKNVIFHVWPYWREVVHSECGRMRLPPVTVPMLRAGATPSSAPQVLTSSGMTVPIMSQDKPQ